MNGTITKRILALLLTAAMLAGQIMVSAAMADTVLDPYGEDTTGTASSGSGDSVSTQGAEGNNPLPLSEPAPYAAAGAASGTNLENGGIMVKVTSQADTVENGDVYTFRVRVDDTAPNDLPNINAGDKLSLKLPGFLTVADMTEALRDSFYYFNEQYDYNPNTNVLVLTFKPQSGTIVYAQFSLSMQVNLNGYDGDGSESIEVYLGNITTQPADASVGIGVGTGSGGGSETEYLIKNIWDNARSSQSLPGTYVINDKAKPIGYSVTIGVRSDYATKEGNINRTVSISDGLSNGSLQLCTSAGAAATEENFAGCFRILIGGSVVKAFSSTQTTITGTALGDITLSYNGNSFQVTAANGTSTDGAVIPLTILYYAKLVGDPSSVQNSVTATIADRSMGTTETVLRQYDSDGLIIRKAILSGGNEVAAVELEEGGETARVTFRITATQYGDNDDDGPGKQIAADVLEDCFTFQSADIPAGSPYTLTQDETDPQIIHIARSSTQNPVPAGVYPMTLTVTVNRSKLAYGQVAHNQVGNDTVIIRRMAKLTIDKTWLGGKDPGSGATFTLNNTAGNTVATSGVKANGTSYTLWISADKLSQGTADYTLTEEVAENGQYVAMNPRVIAITKDEDGKITFANNTGALTVKVENEADSGKGSVAFTKYAGAKKNGQTIDGGSYQLRRVTGTDTSDLVATFTTANGVWQSGELDYGTYFVRELSAPAGYVFDITKQDSNPVTLSKNNKNGSSYLENELYTGGKLTVAKTDGNGGALSGITFTLKKGNQTIAQKITDANGRAVFSGLAVGEYTVAETVPFGYGGFQGSVAFTVDATGAVKAVAVAVTGPGSAAIEGSSITLNWVNTRQFGSLTVYKRDGTATGDLLGGAQFALYRVEETIPADGTTQVGEPVITGSTGENLGKAVFPNLPYGDYILKETEAPAGYDIPAELKAGVPVSIGRAQGANVSYTAVDQTVKGKITVKKTGANGAALAGALFELTGGGLATGLTGVSDAKGLLSFTGLEAGIYTLKELSAPAGYVADPNPKTVVLGNTGNDTWVWEQTVTVANTQKLYTVRVVKSETDNAARLLPGAEFTLYRANGITKVSGPVVTDSFGIAEFSNIPYGTYVLKETKAPSGYALNAAPVSVVIDNATTATVAVGGTLIYSVENDYTRLTVTKFEQENSGKTLFGATFRILSGNQYVVAALGEDGTYAFTGLGGEGEATAFVTGAKGAFQLNCLPLGNYSLKEIAPPEGYELVTGAKAFSITAKENAVSFGNSMIKADVRLVKTDAYGKLLPNVRFVLTSTTDQTVFFTATTDASGAAKFAQVPFGSYTLTEDASTTPMGLKPIEPQIVAVKTTQTVSLTLVNPRITGNIRFTKADLASAAGAPAGLAGAVFALRAVKDENALYASNETGYYFAYAVSGGDGAVEFTGVPFGVYQLSELAAPEHYVKSDEVKYVSIGGATLAGVAISDLNGYVWYNQSLTGSVTVTKADSHTGAALTGAVFSLLDENKGFLSTHAMNNGTTTLTISGLIPGVYYLQETQAPAEYVLNNTPVSFMITGRETAPISLTVENDPFTGSLTVIKTDKADGAGLRGAVFAVYSKADYNRIGQSAEALYTLVTGNDGKAQLSAIPYGEYAAVEITPPDGYELSAEQNGNVRFFTVSNGEEGGAAVSLTFANEKSRYLIMIHKVDLATADSAAPAALAGATFTVTDGKGFSLVSGPTGEDGTVTVAVPAMGTYYVTERTAPAGYSVDPISYSVTVNGHTGESAIPKAQFTSLDKKILGSVTWKKTDEAGDLLSAEFALYRMENGAEQPVTFTQSGNGHAYGNGYVYAGTGAQPTAISAGEAALTGLPGGDYILKETKVPDGFMALGDTPFTVDESNFETALSFTLVNLPHQKGVGVIKQNASGLRLAGAEFTLYKVGETTSAAGITQVGQSVTTGAAGLAVFPELTSGSYILKETKAPSGYRADKAEGYPFTIDGAGRLTGAGFMQSAEDSGFYLITVENPYQEHTFTLNKTSSVTGAPLSGATFRMVGGAIDQTITVGETGSVSVTLPVGEYLLSETVAPKGYLLDPTGHRVVVTGEGITVDGKTLTGEKPFLTLANTPENFLFRLVKQNTDTAQPIGGVAFTLSQNNQVAATLVTGEDGISNTVSLTPGSYVLSETTPAPGYVKPLTSWTITVAEGSLTPAIQGDNKGFAMENGILTITLANRRIVGEIVIVKTGEGGEPLADALFEVLDENGANLYFTGVPGAYMLADAENAQAGALLRTNGEGRAVLSGVPFGGYTVKEHTPPTGYQLNESPFAAEITKENQSITVRVPNALKMLKVTVYKAAAGTATDLLLGATFALYERVDGNDGYALGKLLGTADTGYDGKAEFTVPYGKYVILETKAPAGYERDGTQAFAFDYDDAVATATLEHTFHNEKSVYSIEICKVDGAEKTKGLAGAVFLVTDGRGYSTQVTTGSDGKATLSGIAYDDYTIREIAPPKGYQLNSTVYTVKKAELTHGRAVTVTVPNPYISATVRLKKIDHESRAVISGAEFTLSDASGAVLRFEQSGGVYTLSETGAVSVIRAGEATLKGLPEGTYTLTETKAPAGYVPLDGGRTFAVNAQNFENDIVLEVENLLRKTAVGIIKIDSVHEDVRLPGAEFTLLRLEDDHREGAAVTTAVTDSAGLAVFSGLAMGSYRIRETKAPSGYQLWINPIDFTVTAEGKVQVGAGGTLLTQVVDEVFVARVSNRAITKEFTLSKVDSATGAALAGAKFRLTGQLESDTLTTGSLGTAKATLPVGTYTLEEIAAPDGYGLSTETYRLTVTENGISVNGAALGSDLTLTVKNTQAGYPIRIYKTDAASGAALSGAWFAISGGGRTYTAVTEANGLTGFLTLAPGVYTVSEYQAPTGYALPSAPWTLHISSSGRLLLLGSGSTLAYGWGGYTLHVTNTAAGSEEIPLGDLPKTGQGGAAPMLFTGAVLMLCSFGGLLALLLAERRRSLVL